MDRPIGVWLVFVGFIAYGVFSIGMQAYALTHYDTLSRRMQANFADISMEEILLMAGIQLVPVVGGMALVMMMRAACYIFTVYFIVLILLTVLSVGAEIAANTFTGAGFGGTIFAIAIAHSAHRYAWKLAKDGALS